MHDRVVGDHRHGKGIIWTPLTYYQELTGQKGFGDCVQATALKTAPTKAVGLSKPTQPLAKVNRSFTVSLSCGLSYSEKKNSRCIFLVSNFVN